ncbi:hypothetical protein MMC06_004391 [Schaereria dolodes]|nr:hypothetical protein [Schaereria dolodes]
MSKEKRAEQAQASKARATAINVYRELWTHMSGEGQDRDFTGWTMFSPSPEEVKGIQTMISNGTLTSTRFLEGKFKNVFPRFVRLTDVAAGLLIQAELTNDCLTANWNLDFNSSGTLRKTPQRRSFGDPSLDKNGKIHTHYGYILRGNIDIDDPANANFLPTVPIRDGQPQTLAASVWSAGSPFINYRGFTSFTTPEPLAAPAFSLNSPLHLRTSTVATGEEPLTIKEGKRKVVKTPSVEKATTVQPAKKAKPAQPTKPIHLTPMAIDSDDVSDDETEESGVRSPGQVTGFLVDEPSASDGEATDEPESLQKQLDSIRNDYRARAAEHTMTKYMWDEKVTALVMAGERIDALVVGQGLTIQSTKQVLKEVAKKLKRGSIQDALRDVEDHQELLKDIPQRNNSRRNEAQKLLDNFPYAMRRVFSHHTVDQSTPDETTAWAKKLDMDHIWERGDRFGSKHTSLANLQKTQDEETLVEETRKRKRD